LRRFLEHKPVLGRTPGAAARLADWLCRPARRYEAGGLAVAVSGGAVLWGGVVGPPGAGPAPRALKAVAARALFRPGAATAGGPGALWGGLAVAAADRAVTAAGLFGVGGAGLDVLFPSPDGLVAVLALLTTLSATVFAPFLAAGLARLSKRSL